MARTTTVTEARPVNGYGPERGARDLYRAKGAAGNQSKAGGVLNKAQHSVTAVPSAQPGAKLVPSALRATAATQAGNADGAVTGPNLFKYYHPPAGTAAANLTGTLKMDTTRQSEDAPQSTKAAVDVDTVVNDDGTISTGVQTAFRDGEAQTDPFSPDTVLPPGQVPEVARLAFLKFGGQPGHALPVGLADVEAVEEERIRARIQRALPPVTDEANFHVRKSLMEGLELRAFAKKEAEADAANNVRLTLISQALELQANDRAIIAEQRVELLRKQLEEETSKKLHEITTKRLKTLRKIGAARTKEETQVDMLTGTGTFTGVGVGQKHGSKKPTRDIIADYADPGSRVYAPYAREGQGRHLDKLKTASKFEVTAGLAPGLGGANALDSLTKTLPPSLFTVRVGGSGAGAAASLRKGKTTATGKVSGNAIIEGRKAAAEAAIAADLERVYSMIQTVKAGLSTTEVENEKVPAWRVPKPAIERPATPSYDDVDEDEETARLEAAVSLLQTLLRGRAVQNAMQAGTERRRELIREMRADLLTDEEAAQLASEERARAQSAARRDAVTSTVDTVAGEAASAALDFFAKELRRSQEMARISALAAAADAERKRREDAEAGRRWDEAHARSLEAAYARTAAQIVASATESIVRMAFGDAIAEVAHGAAGRSTRLVTSVLRPIVEKLEAEGTDLTTGLGILDRIPDFPLPHERSEGKDGDSPARRGRPDLRDVDGGVASMDQGLDTTAGSLDLSDDGEGDAFSPAGRGRKGAGVPSGEDHAAVKIQAIARGRKDRKRVASLRKPAAGGEDGSGSPSSPDGFSPVVKVADEASILSPWEADAGSNQAAIRIQAIARGRNDRKRVQAIRTGGSPSPDRIGAGLQDSSIESMGSIGSIEEGQDGSQGGSPGGPGGEDSFDPKQAKAATKIQAVARGRKDRKKVASFKSAKGQSTPQDALAAMEAHASAQAAAAAEEAAMASQDASGAGAAAVEAGEDASKAAVKIQAIARGRHDRKKVAGLKVHAGWSKHAQAAGSSDGAHAQPADGEVKEDEEQERRLERMASTMDESLGGPAGSSAEDGPDGSAVDKSAELAATRIQAVARGHQGRKKVLGLKGRGGASGSAEDEAEGETEAQGLDAGPAMVMAEGEPAPEAVPAEAEAAPEAEAEAAEETPAAE